MKVPRMGAKTFEQCAGFLRIAKGKHPLDNTAVHPERYALVEQMARDMGCTISQLIADPSLRRGIDLKRYCSASIGMPTLNDIMQELEKPGRDPRTDIETATFDDNVNTIDDLIEGMELQGVVTNITQFGVFVDIGIHENGLVHISELSNRFVKSPAEVVKIGQKVTVRVKQVDRQRSRIALTMKGVKQ